MSEKDYDGSRKRGKEIEESRSRAACLSLEECLLARWNAN